jgi:hypothetical protein
MAYVAPSTVTTLQTYTSAAHNIIVNDIIDHETYISPLRSGWTSYTPTLAQGASTNISKTVNKCSYLKIGCLLYLNMYLDVTGAGTAGSDITISVPSGVTMSPINQFYLIGQGLYYDASTTTRYPGSPFQLTSTTIGIRRTDIGTANGIGGDPNIAAANGDGFFLSCIAEVTP